VEFEWDVAVIQRYLGRFNTPHPTLNPNLDGLLELAEASREVLKGYYGDDMEVCAGWYAVDDVLGYRGFAYGQPKTGQERWQKGSLGFW
jgi:hypothetical protein